jgi:hypothetical protein
MKKIPLALLMSMAIIVPSRAKVLKHFECSGMIANYSTGIADLSIGGGDAMCYFVSESTIGKRILRTCHVGQHCRVIGTVKNEEGPDTDWSPTIIDMESVRRIKGE